MRAQRRNLRPLMVDCHVTAFLAKTVVVCLCERSEAIQGPRFIDCSVTAFLAKTVVGDCHVTAFLAMTVVEDCRVTAFLAMTVEVVCLCERSDAI